MTGFEELCAERGMNRTSAPSGAAAATPRAAHGNTQQ
jgi:hypothetical protein